MNNLYEALEICLQDIEQGADLETVLFRYPDLAEELRPILEASMGAKRMAAPAPSADVVRRNRAKVLQQAAQMREAKVKSSKRTWFVSLRRVAVTLAVVTALFVSGTGLVRAASTTLPGDNLYPVKRTWEDVLLLFTFNLQQREALELEHENERLYELIELFAEGRTAEVDFSGIVTSQTGNEWTVNGVQVMVSPQTEVRDGPITVGSAVRVRGVTQGKGIVLAERIRVLSPDDKLPEIEYEHEDEDGNDNEGSDHPSEDNSGPGSGSESSNIEETPTPEFKPRKESLEGVVVSVDNNTLVVNAITVDMSAAEEIKGTPAIGVPVKVEGYYDVNGVFIVTKIEFKNEESGSGSDGDNDSQHSNSNDDGDNRTGTSNDNTNDNSGSDDSSDDSGGSNDNSGDDKGGNDNGDDSGGGGDNSGSGGGGGGDD